MSKKPSAPGEIPTEEDFLNPYFRNCAENSLPVSLSAVNTILKTIDD